MHSITTQPARVWIYATLVALANVKNPKFVNESVYDVLEYFYNVFFEQHQRILNFFVDFSS